MLIETKIFCEEVNPETEGFLEYWEKFNFDLKKYVAHSEHDFGSVLYLEGMPGAIVIQLSFDEFFESLTCGFIN